MFLVQRRRYRGACLIYCLFFGFVTLFVIFMSPTAAQAAEPHAATMSSFDRLFAAPSPALSPVATSVISFTEEFDNAGLFSKTPDADINVTGGQAVWTFHRNRGQQYLYRTIPSFSGDVRITVNGKMDAAANGNCGITVGLTRAIPTAGIGPYFGHVSCANQKSMSATGAFLDQVELSCGLYGQWLWLTPGTYYTATMVVHGNAVDLGLNDGSAIKGSRFYTDTFDQLYIGATGAVENITCSGAVERVTVEQLPDSDDPHFTEVWETGFYTGWQRYGSPQPLLVAGEGVSGTTALNPNGDSSYPSGVQLVRSFYMPRGLSVEFWARGNAAPGTAYSGMYVNLSACSPQPNLETCEDMPVHIVFSAEGNVVGYRLGAESVDESWSPLNNQWHKYRFTVQPDGTTAFYRDGVLKHAPTTRLNLSTYAYLRLRIDGRSVNSAWYIDDIVVDDVTPPGQPSCYSFALAYTGSGQAPVPAPANSSGCQSQQYRPSEIVTVVALPASGWHVSSWQGTENDASTAVTNTVLMPAMAHTVTVNYAVDSPSPSCFILELRQTGTGSAPSASPASSSGCQLQHYVAGEIITVTALPSSGWYVSGWLGTDNNASTVVTNTVVMPAMPHTVTVNYEETPATGTSTFLPAVLSRQGPVAPPQWTRLGAPGQVLSELLVNDSQIMVAHRRIAAAGGGIYRGTIASACTTVVFDQPNPAAQISSFAANPLVFLAGALAEKSVYRSENGGDSWSSSTPLSGPIYSVAVDVSGSTAYAGADDGVHRSSDGGINWTSAAAPINVNVLRTYSNGTLWVGTNGSGVWINQSSAAWQPAQHSDGLSGDALKVWDFVFDGVYVYAATEDGVYRAEIGNVNWQPWGLQGKFVRSLELAAGKLYAGLTAGGVWQTPLSASPPSWTALTGGTGWSASYTVRDLYWDSQTCGGLLAATDDGLWIYR